MDKIRRFDIWLTDLSEVGIDEKHYTLCVSNWKNNIKSTSVNCCMITSQIKEHPCHVTFKGFGLEKISQVKCEKIFTIEKNMLKEKVGNITDIGLQLEIEKALEIQLQLDERYNNTDTDQLENLFMKKVSTMNNKSKYDNLKSQIRDAAYNNDYSYCVGKCTELIEIINKAVKSENNQKYLYYAYYHRAIMFNKLKEYNLALVDAKESLKYVGDIKTQLNNQYAYAMWAISSIYENLNFIDKSMEIYSTLSKYYKNIGKTSMRLEMIFNIACLRKNVGIMKKLIKIANQLEFKEYETNKTKEELIKQMERELILVTQ